MVGVDVGFRAAHVFSWKLARLCTLKKKTNRQHLGQNKLEKHVCVDLLKMLGKSKKKFSQMVVFMVIYHGTKQNYAKITSNTSKCPPEI